MANIAGNIVEEGLEAVQVRCRCCTACRHLRAFQLRMRNFPGTRSASSFSGLDLVVPCHQRAFTVCSCRFALLANSQSLSNDGEIKTHILQLVAARSEGAQFVRAPVSQRLPQEFLTALSRLALVRTGRGLPAAGGNLRGASGFETCVLGDGCHSRSESSIYGLNNLDKKTNGEP